jgi:hypothetical protein
MMDADEFRSVVNRIGWSLEITAKRAHRSYSRIRKMASGRDMVDEALETWLRAIVAVINNPPEPLARTVHPDELEGDEEEP